MKSTILKDTMILTLITLISGLLLGLVYGITKEPIKKQEETAKMKAYQEVFPQADSFRTLYDGEDKGLQDYLKVNGHTAVVINEVMQAEDAEKNILGYAFNITTSEGYGGDITFSMGVQNDGTINCISILNINETAGLGMNAKKAEFKNQYAGKNVEHFTVTKSGSASESEIDAISGATRTSRAVTGGVNAGLCAFRYVKEGE